jgi:Fe-S-cluster containining protein
MRLNYKLQYENVVFPDSVSFECKNCGFCCQFPSDVNPEEQRIIEKEGFTNFTKKDITTETQWIKNKDGTCFFLTENKKCRINHIKPSMCKLEPFTIIDYDYETNRIFLDLDFYAVGFCKGISTGELKGIKEIAEAAQAIVREWFEIVAAKTGLQVTDKKVGLLIGEMISQLNSKRMTDRR